MRATPSEPPEPISNCSALSSSCSHFWYHPKTKHVAHTVRRAIVGGVKVSALTGVILMLIGINTASGRKAESLQGKRAIIIGTTFLFGASVEPALFNFPKIDRLINPFWNAIIRGVMAALVKIILLISIIASTNAGCNLNKETEKCSRSAQTIIFSLLSLIIPSSLFAAYNEYKKYAISPNFSQLYRHTPSCLKVSPSHPIIKTVNQLPLSISTMAAFFSLIDLISHIMTFVYFISDEQARNEKQVGILLLTLKIVLGIFGLILGKKIEKKYQDDPIANFNIKKKLFIFNETCQLCYFSFLSYTIASPVPIDSPPALLYTIPILMTLIGTGFCVHDEIYHKFLERDHHRFFAAKDVANRDIELNLLSGPNDDDTEAPSTDYACA